jgi:predicted cupin superfamily sugar epimerase
MTNDLSAEDVRALLKLEPHATCGYVRVTFISNQRIAPGGLPAPFLDGRPAGSALYFMVTPDAPVRLHRIRNDQLYHRYLGDPIEIIMLHENGTSERAIVGPDLRAGQCVQLLIPGNTFHTARVIGQRRWFLGASTEWPGVEKVDVELGDVEALAAKYPDGRRSARISARVAHTSRALASASRNRELFWRRGTPCNFQLSPEDCFGVTPKPACETHALPERHDLNAARVTN